MSRKKTVIYLLNYQHKGTHSGQKLLPMSTENSWTIHCWVAKTYKTPDLTTEKHIQGNTRHDSVDRYVNQPSVTRCLSQGVLCH